MAHHDIRLVLGDFQNGVRRSRRLADAAQAWLSNADGPKRPRYSAEHRDLLYQLAYLNAFLTWEKFLEESFILYLWGRNLHRRNVPRRFITPPTREYAIQLSKEGTSKDYVDWDNAQTVRERARRFFVNGDPYETALKNRQHQFRKMEIVRHAMVHSSSSSHANFKDLLREDLGSGHLGSNIGRYLATTKPNSVPPKCYFDVYMSTMIGASLEIVPLGGGARP